MRDVYNPNLRKDLSSNFKKGRESVKPNAEANPI